MSSEDNSNKSVTTTSNDDNNNKKTVTLKTCSDGETFEVEVSVISQSGMIKHMIEEDCADEFIPVSNVEGKVLAKVIEYLKKHYKSADGVVDEKITKKEIREWDIEFVSEMDHNSVFALMLAANYLEVEGLLKLAAQKMADNIKDKPIEEIRKLFNLENDFGPGVEEEIRSRFHGVGERQFD